MKRIELPKVSERQQVAAILLIVALLLGLVWWKVIEPQRKLRAEIASRRASLSQKRYANVTESSMKTALEVERSMYQQLLAEWSQTAARLTVFDRSEVFAEGTSVDRIDYKVELYNERRRLAEKAKLLDTNLSASDLGLADVVASGEDARVLMMQLRTVQKLADLTLDRKIQRIVSLEPLEPIRHSQAQHDNVFLEEYPVQIEFDTPLENLYELLHAIFEKDQVFVFRNIRVTAGATRSDPLRVNAIMSALVFSR